MARTARPTTRAARIAAKAESDKAKAKPQSFIRADAPPAETPPIDPPSSPTPEVSQKGTRETLTLKLDANGRVDWNELSEKRRARARAAGVSIPGESGVGPAVLNAQDYGALLDMVGGAMVLAAAQSGVPMAQAMTLQFTKAEHALIDPALNKCLATLGGAAWLDQYMPWIMLAASLGQVGYSKYLLLQSMRAIDTKPVAPRAESPRAEPPRVVDITTRQAPAPDAPDAPEGDEPRAGESLE